MYLTHLHVFLRSTSIIYEYTTNYLCNCWSNFGLLLLKEHKLHKNLALIGWKQKRCQKFHWRCSKWQTVQVSLQLLNKRWLLKMRNSKPLRHKRMKCQKVCVKTIFKSILRPLSGLSWKTNRWRTNALSRGCFSICHHC